MIEKLDCTEREYREVKLPSYSLLKRLDEMGPKSLLKSQKLEGDYLEFGDLLDCILLQPEQLGEKFYFEAVDKPTEQLLELADHIISLDNAEDLINDVIEVNNISLELNLFGNTKDTEKRIIKFNTPKFWNYIRAKLNSRGKTVFSRDTETEAYMAVDILKNNPRTAQIFNPNEDVEVINQLKLVAKIEGYEVKGMIDRVHIDHKTKTIYPFDLKSTEFRLVNFKKQFIKMKYYLQASLYSAMLAGFIKYNYPDYVLAEFRFIVYSKSDRNVAVFVVSDTWLNNGYFGFIDYKGDYIKGIAQLLKDYYYYITDNIYTVEREILESNEITIL